MMIQNRLMKSYGFMLYSLAFAMSFAFLLASSSLIVHGPPSNIIEVLGYPFQFQLYLSEFGKEYFSHYPLDYLFIVGLRTMIPLGLGLLFLSDFIEEKREEDSGLEDFPLTLTPVLLIVFSALLFAPTIPPENLQYLATLIIVVKLASAFFIPVANKYVGIASFFADTITGMLVLINIPLAIFALSLSLSLSVSAILYVFVPENYTDPLVIHVIAIYRHATRDIRGLQRVFSKL